MDKAPFLYVSPQRKKEDNNSNKIGISIILSTLIFLFIIFFSLNYFNILRLDYAFSFLSFLPKREEPVVLPRPAGSSKNTFEKPQKVSKTGLLFYVIEGHVNSVVDDKDGKLIYMFKSNGEIIKDPIFVKNSIRPTLVSKTGKERITTLNDITKGDYLMISINEDPNSGKKEVTGIRIN